MGLLEQGAFATHRHDGALRPLSMIKLSQDGSKRDSGGTHFRFAEGDIGFSAAPASRSIAQAISAMIAPSSRDALAESMIRPPEVTTSSTISRLRPCASPPAAKMRFEAILIEIRRRGGAGRAIQMQTIPYRELGDRIAAAGGVGHSVTLAGRCARPLWPRRGGSHRTVSWGEASKVDRPGYTAR
jgi:hypothetical protein